MARLIVLAGLPASGKSTIARELAARSGAIWLRVDSMDRAILASGTAPDDLRDWTYRAGQAIAADNLALGRDVIADCVNDWQVARDGWEACAKASGAEVVWLEVVCSDAAEHRRRVETRETDLPGLPMRDWQAVTGREYHGWDRDRLTVDTAGRDVEDCVQAALAGLAQTGRTRRRERRNLTGTA
jgi:predicted kinase